MRILWGSCGLISLALGLLGTVVPLLPTVPFLILAAFCFARSSERLHGWLMTHPRFGPMIDDWQARGAINLRVKRISTLSIVAVFAFSLIMDLRPTILVIQALVLSGVMIFIWSRPNA